jgi:hypothetical protein
MYVDNWTMCEWTITYSSIEFVPRVLYGMWIFQCMWTMCKWTITYLGIELCMVCGSFNV